MSRGKNAVIASTGLALVPTKTSVWAKATGLPETNVLYVKVNDGREGSGGTDEQRSLHQRL